VFRRVQKFTADHSIISSARTSNEGGTVRPSALAVLIHHQFELGRLLDWQVGWLRTLENLVDESGGPTK
jgi:hypothetical protein